MKITRMSCYAYELPLRSTLILKGVPLNCRRGLLLRLEDDGGRIGWGEIAPLPGFSRETPESAHAQFQQVCQELVGKALPERLERLDGGFNDWLGQIKLLPSIRFGIETCVLQLIAQEQGKPVRTLLSDKVRDSVAVNALLTGAEEEIVARAAELRDQGYTTFKLKVGSRSFYDDVQIVFRVRDAIGRGATLRLDANRSFDSVEARRFGEAVKGAGIDYIEEPVRNYLELLHVTNRGGFPLPIALDESLLSISPKGLTPLRGVRAVVLKPTLLGYEWSMWFARRAQRAGMIAVASSAFESSLGLRMIAALGGCFNGGTEGSDIAMGLSTLDWLAEDLVSPPVSIVNGRIDLTVSQALPVEVHHHSLKELSRE